MIFNLLTVLIAVVCLGAIALAALRYRDSFHPLAYLGAMLGILYVGYPAYLRTTDQLWVFLNEGELEFIQTVNLVGVVSMLLGLIVGSGRTSTRPAPLTVLPEAVNRRLRAGALAIGLVSLVGYVYGVINVGGFDVAYGQAYGGGGSESGYARELPLLAIPSIALLLLSQAGRRPSGLLWLAIFILILPLMVHGLLGARRGPTFMALASLGVCWYLVRQRRPRIVTLLAGGALLGLLMLFLVSNRGQIYLGSGFEFDRSPFAYLEPGAGNEFLYGGANIVESRDTDWYFWGRRQIVLFIVRPIPRAIWPDQYEETAEYLGLAGQLDNGNVGLPNEALLWRFGWRGAIGATPGIVADAWVDFWWLSVIELFALGYAYGWLWRKMRSGSPLFTTLFGIATSLSVYMVMQSFEALGFRFMIMSVATCAVWVFATRFALSERGPVHARVRPIGQHPKAQAQARRAHGAGRRQHWLSSR